MIKCDIANERWSVGIYTWTEGCGRKRGRNKQPARTRASEVYERMTRLISKRRTTERETKERRKDVAQWQEVEVMREKNEMSSRTGSGIYTLSSDKSPKKAKRQKSGQLHPCN